VSAARRALVSRLAGALSGRDPGRPLLVAIDGPDAAGKTMLADELVEPVGSRAERIGIDGFLRPRRERHLGRAATPEGYYRDAFDIERFRAHVLEPLAPAGDRLVRVSTYDYQADVTRLGQPCRFAADSIDLVDGVFLQRPELADAWDVVVYLHVSAAETMARAVERDAAVFGSVAETERRYRDRYLPAQRLYLDEAEPERRAHVVIDNGDPAAPVVLRWRLL
jgi:uridine kinase